MKVMYTSNVPEQASTIVNMLTTAVMGDILYRRQSILLKAQFDRSNSKLPLQPFEQGREANEFEAEINTFWRMLREGKNTEESFKNCFSTMIRGDYKTAGGGNVYNSKGSDSKRIMQFQKMVEVADQLYDMVFIDIGSVKHEISERLWEQADILVVTLSPKSKVLDDFFTRYSLPQNTIFLFRSSGQCFTAKKQALYRRYRKLNEGNTYFIPYDMEVITDALELSTFYYNHMFCEKGDENYYFINEVKRATRDIYNLADHIVEERERVKKLDLLEMCCEQLIL